MSQNVTFLSLRSLIQIYYFKNGPNIPVTSQITSTPIFITTLLGVNGTFLTENITQERKRSITQSKHDILIK